MTHPAHLPVVEDNQANMDGSYSCAGFKKKKKKNFKIFHLRIQTQSDKHWLSNKNMNVAQGLNK